jgi:23S rRNA (pseudouridine1915-N3)-methyltransferase
VKAAAVILKQHKKMKLRIISVGHKMPAWVQTACTEYIKRMPRELSIEIIEIKPKKRAAGNSSENIQALEAKSIIEAAGDDFLVICDEHGQQINTLTLADKLRSWQNGIENNGKNVSFIVGGADGLHTNIKKNADFNLGLSQLTLPHAFVRVLLCEQLYRAYSVNTNHPYHRE